MSKSAPTLVKLRKLRRDPSHFFYDFFRKRLQADVTPTPIGATDQVELTTEDYEIVDGVALVENPEVVRRLSELKGQRRIRRLAVSWWK